MCFLFLVYEVKWAKLLFTARHINKLRKQISLRNCEYVLTYFFCFWLGKETKCMLYCIWSNMLCLSVCPSISRICVWLLCACLIQLISNINIYIGYININIRCWCSTSLYGTVHLVFVKCYFSFTCISNLWRGPSSASVIHPTSGPSHQYVLSLLQTNGFSSKVNKQL